MREFDFTTLKVVRPNGRLDRARPIEHELVQACYEGHASEIWPLIAEGANKDLRLQVDFGGETYSGRVIHLAARFGHDDVCVALIDNDAEIAGVDSQNASLLHMAAMAAMLQTTMALLDREADINLPCEERERKSPLVLAIELKSIDVAMLLLMRGADPNQAFDRGLPLTSALWHGAFDMARGLVDRGARLDAPLPAGHSIAAEAASWGRPAAMNFLLDLGVDFLCQGPDGKTPLDHVVARSGAFGDRAIHFLMALGADVSEHKKIFDEARLLIRTNRLYHAAAIGHEKLFVKALEEGSNPNELMGDGIRVDEFVYQKDNRCSQILRAWQTRKIANDVLDGLSVAASCVERANPRVPSS